LAERRLKLKILLPLPILSKDIIFIYADIS
jgi:hypothetical protein